MSLTQRSGHRVERLAEQIRNEISAMLEGELRDPRLEGAELAGVELTADYRRARVWIRTSGTDAEAEATLEGLASAAPYVRRTLCQRLGIRRAPELVFRLEPRSSAAEETSQSSQTAN